MVEFKEAEYYEKKESDVVRCHLCPHLCLIKNGDVGNCKARKNIDGVLYALGYDRFTSVHDDPIEKKPLYHYKPGSSSLSFGSAGCNLHCDFCQNWTISQSTADSNRLTKVSSKQAIDLVKRYQCETISYTYNEPLINFEWIRDTAIIARDNKIGNVLVSNGLINEEPLRELLPLLNAVNIDVKSFDPQFYRDYCHFPALDIVKNNVTQMFKAGIHIELTMLIIPGFNDQLEQIEHFTSWVLDNLSSTVPLHFSRFYPHYKFQHVPPTPVETILNAKKVAQNMGTKYVYTGNLPYTEINTTYCQNCNAVLVERTSYNTKIIKLNGKNLCVDCCTKSDIVL